MNEGPTFRYAIGILAILGGLASLGLLFFVEVPLGNKEPLLLAIGIVLGWGGSVVQSEYGSTSSGRNLAQTNAQIVKDTAASPTGKTGDPLHTIEESKP